MKTLFYTTVFVVVFLGVINNTQAQTKRTENPVFTLNQQTHKYYINESNSIEAVEINVYNK